MVFLVYQVIEPIFPPENITRVPSLPPCWPPAFDSTLLHPSEIHRDIRIYHFWSTVSTTSTLSDDFLIDTRRCSFQNLLHQFPHLHLPLFFPPYSPPIFSSTPDTFISIVFSTDIVINSCNCPFRRLIGHSALIFKYHQLHISADPLHSFASINYSSQRWNFFPLSSTTISIF